MAILAQILGGIAGIVGLICYILVIVKMFQAGQTGLAIVCLVLLCCGIGYLIAFIYGWIKAGEWGITNIMIIWSVCWVIGIIAGVMNPAQFTQYQTQFGK